MQVRIPDELDRELSEIGRALKLDKEEVLSRAILLYADSVEKLVCLKEEMNAWDELSDEVLRNFECRCRG